MMEKKYMTKAELLTKYYAGDWGTAMTFHEFAERCQQNGIVVVETNTVEGSESAPPEKHVKVCVVGGVPTLENGHLTRAHFEELLDKLDGSSLQTLKEKNARYSADGDPLHNFRSGGDVFGGTPADACWGYMTKHLVALRDMAKRNSYDPADLLEKCQDTINYIRFLYCIGMEQAEKEGKV